MASEQIDLVVLKKLIDGAKQLKSKLILMGEKLDAVTQERDSLIQQAQTKYADFLQEKEEIRAGKGKELHIIKLDAQKQIDEITRSAEKTQNETVEHYENKLLDNITAYEEKIQQISEDLIQKNSNLDKELKQVKDSHQAVVDRIRGLS